MPVKQVAVLLSIVVLSLPAYAQKGVEKAVEIAVQRQVVNRAKLPTLRDGMRNLVTHRLGPVHPAVAAGYAAVVHNPVRSVLDFGKLLREQQVRVVEFPRIVGGRHDKRQDGFYSIAKPGSGNIAAIALPAHALINQVAAAQWASVKERKVYSKMVEALDTGFVMSGDGNWNLIRGYSFARIHQLIGHLKQQWPVYSKAYGGEEEPMSKGLQVALDVLDIQTWMLTHDGKFPTRQVLSDEFELVRTFDALINDMATKPEVASDPSVQGAVQHLVHLRAAARGAMTPSQVVLKVLERVDNGGRISGSSLVRVTPKENLLIRELNYVEQLRRANLLYILVPMQQQREGLALHLKDFQEQGYIYRQMIKHIPEFAADGTTLNVPTRTHVAWEVALDNWKWAHGNVFPRAAISGQFGLPINFNDLTPEEQAEVLLGTYLRIKDK